MATDDETKRPSKRTKRPSRRTSSANGNGGGKWIWPVTRLAIYLRDGFTCLYCERGLFDAAPRDITLDHLACRAKSSKPDNRPCKLLTACRSCNSKRQDKPLAEFAEIVCKDLYGEHYQRYHVEWVVGRIRRHTRRSLRRYAILAKSLIEERANDKAQVGSAIQEIGDEGGRAFVWDCAGD